MDNVDALPNKKTKYAVDGSVPYKGGRTGSICRLCTTPAINIYCTEHQSVGQYTCSFIGCSNNADYGRCDMHQRSEQGPGP